MGPEAASAIPGLSADFTSWITCTQRLEQKFLSGRFGNDYIPSPGSDICQFCYTL